ncbi:hypothetical protein HD554DRAFT_2179352 [Boletus coccyginus]|nr:hypothetical protein HD554DRAFT_2179352 [Boletus coccyginus]
MPYGESLASGPVGTPAIYNPNMPRGSRWSNAGLASSDIVRIYYYSAILLPDASVLIAGSNPNVDVNTSTIFPTTYTAEIFYPPYFSASVRAPPAYFPPSLMGIHTSTSLFLPVHTLVPQTPRLLILQSFLPWGLHYPCHEYGPAFLQLNNTYTVPPNPNLLTPGPCLMFVLINGIPSNGTMVIVGNGQIGPGQDTQTGSGSSSNKGVIVGIVVGVIAAIGIVSGIFGVLAARRRRAANRQHPSAAYAMGATRGGFGSSGAAALNRHADSVRNSDSSAFVPLQQDNPSMVWYASTASLQSPFRDDYDGRPP